MTALGIPGCRNGQQIWQHYPKCILFCSNSNGLFYGLDWTMLDKNNSNSPTREDYINENKTFEEADLLCVITMIRNLTMCI